MGWELFFSTRILGGFVFCTPFSSNDVCNAVTPLTHFGGDTQNLATSHLSLWNIYVKNKAFFTTCFVYNEWPTWFLDFCSQKVELTASEFGLLTGYFQKKLGDKGVSKFPACVSPCFFFEKQKRQDFSSPKTPASPTTSANLWNLQHSPRWA